MSDETKLAKAEIFVRQALACFGQAASDAEVRVVALKIVKSMPPRKLTTPADRSGE